MKKMLQNAASFKWITHTLLLSIIPVILFGTIIYHLGSRIVQEEIHRASQESLSQVRYQIESKMKNIEQMSNQIALQSDIISVMNATSEPQLGASLTSNDVRYLLSRMKNVTDTVHSIYFYHFQQRIVLTNDIITDIDEERVFRDLSWLDYVDELKARKQHQMWVTPRNMVSANGGVTSTLTHVRLLPLLYSEAKASIIVNLNPDFLTQSISGFPLGSDGKLIVLNGDKERIAQTPGGMMGAADYAAMETAAAGADDAGAAQTSRIGGQFFTVLKSAGSGWTYVMVVPDNVPRQQVEEFRRIIILITVVLCLLVVYSAYFTHSRFQGSIRNLLDRLSVVRSGEESSKRGDAVAEVESHINRLMSEIKEGKSRQENHLPLLQAHYLHSALHGNAVDISRMTRQLGNEILFPYDRFCVLAIQMDASAKGAFAREQELFLFAVSNIAAELPKIEQLERMRIESVVTHQHTVLILNYDGRATDREPAAVADQLRSIVKQILKHSVTIGVGTPAASAQDLVYSYKEALQALRMNGANTYDEVLPFSNMTVVADKIAQYPALEEQDLLDALRSRNREQAERSLEQFRRKLEQDLASFHMVKTFYLQLLVAVIRLVQEYEEDISRVFAGENPYESFFRMETAPDIHEWFQQRLLNPILLYMDSVKRRKTELVIKRTIELIHAKYQSDLSLQAAAEEIGISASYLSQLFKDELGETFIEYVTRIRLEHAQRLLTDTELTLQQIADAIGYTSVQQLFRVFKKRWGMTPGEYREKHSTS